LDDARRRDITINALFYNLHSLEVEDFTGMGLDDLRCKIIRTPLPPLQTFTDDPLRILRVVRFATRFGYEISLDIYEATQDQAIKRAFETKLSRERIGVEIHKMFKGADPLRAIQLICDFNCYHSVFLPPPDVLDQMVSPIDALKVSKTLNLILKSDLLKEITWLSHVNDLEILFHLYLAASICPFRKISYRQKNKALLSPKYVVGTSLKLSTFASDFCTGLLIHSDKISSAILNHDIDDLERKSIGLLIRELGARPVGSNWDLCILTSLAIELSKLGDSITLTKTNPHCYSLFKKYSQFMQRVFSENLQHCYDLRPILDGKRVAELLHIKPGPNVGKLLQQLLEWQISKGEVTTEDAERWILNHYKNELG
jgi:tRNA nucleotidyltransferase (CCA-adding enzyme)